MSKRILIVDDSVAARKLCGMALAKAGYEVVEATDGADGVSKLTGKLHLIISDVNMPRMDGIELLAAIKAHPDYKFTPVIMLTTEAGEDKKSQGRELGAKAWLIKPFQADALVEAVSKLVPA